MNQVRATQQGDVLTNREGTKAQPPAMTFSPPFWIYEQGVATVNYGEDEAAAFEHYDRLVRESRVCTGNLTPVVFPAPRRTVAAPARFPEAVGAAA